MHISRRRYLGGTACVLAALQPLRAMAQFRIVTPEEFGARGDGRSNDTAAFAAMTAFVNSHGGGKIQLRPTTYIVGRQTRASEQGEGYAFEPAPIMDFRGCKLPLVLRGNGARLRCAPALKYGTFDRATGCATHHSVPSYRGNELATPYRAMIHVEECSDEVDISELELDGNLGALEIGGRYGDVGWQIPAIGIHLINNRGPERLSHIHAHHHALDGVLIDGSSERAIATSFQHVRCQFNGRQGCSIVGGRNYKFSDCDFSASGKGRISSAPGAGVDVEAEAGKPIRNLSFLRCTFSNNSGVGLLADGGDSKDAVFEHCTFIGTTSWAAWPNRPRFRFSGCTFVGPIVHAFGDEDRQRACQFHECTFLDDPKLSPNGEVYGGGNPSRPIADLSANPNVLFDRCKFRLTHRAVLPWTTNVVTFANCTMTQLAPARSYPRGTFVGRNIIVGNVDLYSARFEGEVIVNGRKVH